MKNGELEERIIYLDLLRNFAIFAMMMLHVAASNWYITPVSSFEWNVFNVYDSFTRFCVPVFVMISGVFFLDPNREFTMKKLFSKNIFRILTAFVFWSASYSVLRNLFIFKTINFNVAVNFLISFFSGNYHLWFLFTLVGLYLISPFLRKICENKILMQYFLILTFIFNYTINLFLLFPLIGNIMSIGIDKANIFFVLGYSGYFVLGYYLHKHQLPKRIKSLVYIMGIISVVMTIGLTSYLSIHKGEPIVDLYGYLLPNTFFTSSAIFLFFKEKMSILNFSLSMKNLIKTLSKFSFGMFLVHDFFNIMFFKILSFTTLTFNPIFSVPILSIIIYILSFFTTVLISKIPILKKYIL